MEPQSPDFHRAAIEIKFKLEQVFLVFLLLQNYLFIYLNLINLSFALRDTERKVGRSDPLGTSYESVHTTIS